MSYATKEQLEELASYITSQVNVPTIGIGGGYAPIGSINFFDATVAPQDWLACDGSVHNIADYPQLADWYETQHGSKNFYGGDGTTTFAVPDLQGEFLRGTGTNSHTNQGSGAAVGTHQDGTSIPHMASINNVIRLMGSGTEQITPENLDSSYSFVSGTKQWRAASTTNGSTGMKQDVFTSRPTNTSFLICVKAVVAGEVYSTEERVVGTWIDGKKLYQKTFVDATVRAYNIGWFEVPNSTIENLDELISVSGIAMWRDSSGNTINDVIPENINGTEHQVSMNFVSHLAIYAKTGANRSWVKFIITVQYTKTTD